MPDNTRRVNVTLTFATDDVPADVAYSVMAVVRDESRYAHDLESMAVHAFDLTEDDTDRRCGAPGPGEILGPCALPDGHGGPLHVGMNGIAWDPKESR